MKESTDYIVNLENFNGPLDLLLKLIEREKLDICQVSIAKITEDYLSYIQNIQLSHHDVNKFLDIAVKLILTKSKALLPVNSNISNNDDELEYLSEQLLELNSFQIIAKQFEKMQKNRFYSRPKIQNDYKLIRYTNISIASIVSAYPSVSNKNSSNEMNIVTLKRKTNLEKRKYLIDKIYQYNKFPISSILKITDDKKESVMMFMIILEFIKLNKLNVSNNKSLEVEVVR
ncbi:MAG TPA: segregation/condensation protein A [Candidatus Saccharibacteria bacterium]|nr:segregation/condensation protein A [Candidatus Saccharibacteria bacterium]HMT39476.1 segregation/condensation protein A [Candidatus Saccharibacteria bacterium]